jgi:F-type H+-transporting ATPase subunit epsilon
MSTATWRNVFTYNKYTQIAAGAVRRSLKESERGLAERRGVTALRYQNWEAGKGGPQTLLIPVEEDAKTKAKKSAS